MIVPLPDLDNLSDSGSKLTLLTHLINSMWAGTWSGHGYKKKKNEMKSDKTNNSKMLSVTK